MRKALLVVLILSSALAWAQGGCRDKELNGQTTGGFLKAVGSASIRVCTDSASPCTLAPHIYSDAALTQEISNPISLDGSGNYHYCAPVGAYNEQISGAAFTTLNNTPISIAPYDAVSSSAANNFTGNNTHSGKETMDVMIARASVIGTDVRWFGAKCDAYVDAGTAYNGTITTGTNALTVAGLTLGSADIGKRVELAGAGTAGAFLITTIASITDSTHVVLTDAAINTVTGTQLRVGTDDTTSLQNAINYAAAQGDLRANTNYTPTILFPNGNCLSGGLSWSNSYPLLLVGQQMGHSAIVHKNSEVGPLLHVTGGDTGITTSPYGGFANLSLYAGSATTILIDYDGRIDQGVVCRDLQLHGKTGPATMDGWSVRDYLNWQCNGLRLDGIGGYALKARDASVFTNSYLAVTNFEYDNQHGAAGDEQWGAGLLFVDATNLGPSRKGVILLQDARIEINDTLTGNAPQRSLIRVLTDVSNGQTAPLVTVAPHNVEVANASTFADGMNFKFLSTNAPRIGFEPDGLTAYNMAEMVNNDAGTMDQGFRLNNPSQNYWHVSGKGSGGNYLNPASGQFNLLGLNMVSTDSDNNRGTLYGKEGDILWNKRPRNVSGRVGRTFATQIVGMVGAVTPPAGFCRVTPAAATTGTIASGSNLLTITGTLSTDINPSMSLTVTGAGAAGADLVAMITSMNYSTKVITLDTNASTDKSGGTNVAVTKCLTRAVDMVEYGTAAPAADRHETGDFVKNTAPTANGVYGWAASSGGTPGSWVAVPIGDANGKLTNAQLSTPPLPAALVTTATASDNVTVTGMTASGHCQLTPTNASAATNIATTFVSAKTTNQITVSHASTASMNYDIVCTAN